MTRKEEARGMGYRMENEEYQDLRDVQLFQEVLIIIAVVPMASQSLIQLGAYLPRVSELSIRRRSIVDLIYSSKLLCNQMSLACVENM
jgi:hypothetical protein